MMTYSKKICVALSLVLFVTSYSFSQKAYSLKSYKASADGTSTLHDWSSAITKLEWSGQLTVEGANVKAVQNVNVTIPVESIKSEKGGTMDDKTYEAFKSDKNPTITFKLTSATVVSNKITANGTLTMAGVTKPIVMHIDAKVLPDGAVHLSGSQAINMKDYGMTPPKAVMGTIKVGEKVTVLFELVVTP
ncbi:MAG TPA: YceI family protein [Cyclobacteriaceae bacterium]|jgi:polyisoprenoid-binding protein YceI|nr:YceI family protein [Cyclobacteriaceae bacterium]